MIDSSAGWLDAEFRKSSFSGGENGSCVELAWRGATFSTGGDGFGVRDSKNLAGPVLMLGESQGQAFLAAVKRFG
jgi:hypothetical protein